MLKQAFNAPFFIFAALALVSGTVCYLALGREIFLGSLQEDIGLLADVIPKLGAAVLIAAFVQALLPPNFFARYMGEETGLKGLTFATAAGAVTPGGPMTSFPLVSMLQNTGTGRGALIAYVTSWTTMGLQRVFMWEVPLMGSEFAIIRFVASMPLPVIAGLVSRLVPAEPAAIKRQRA